MWSISLLLRREGVLTPSNSTLLFFGQWLQSALCRLSWMAASRQPKSQAFPKRALALTHDSRFNRLRNVLYGPVTRAFPGVFMGKSTPCLHRAPFRIVAKRERPPL
jgi:hypothetical protein